MWIVMRRISSLSEFRHSQMKTETDWKNPSIRSEAIVTKIDFKKTKKNLFAPSSRDFSLVDVPEMQFLMIDGMGRPGTGQQYQQSLEVLYAVSYKIKFISKAALNKDYVVPPLQALWWADDMDTFVRREKDAWKWTVMIMQPDWITSNIYAEAKAAVETKKDLPAIPKLRLEILHEGLSVQILHIGSYDDEGPTIKKLHQQYLPENGLRENGKHHEIYLGDPRKTAPEKLKTILRQPVRRIA